MFAYFRNIAKYKSLLHNLISRDIKVKYRRSFLGILWSVLNPLFTMAVMTVVFTKMLRFQIPYFPIYYLTGQLIFNFFSESTSSAMASIVSNSALIKKVYIPKYIFPLERILFGLVNLGFSFIAVCIMLIFVPVPLSWTMLLSVIPIVYTFVFALGMGMALAALAVFFRDLFHLYGVVITAWSFLTPIFYPVDIIPSQWMFMLECNPLYHFVSYFRNVFMYGTIPPLSENLVCMGMALVMLIIGMLIFRKMQDKFVLYL